MTKLQNLYTRKEAVYLAHQFSGGSSSVGLVLTGFVIPGKLYHVKRIDEKTIIVKEV